MASLDEWLQLMEAQLQDQGVSQDLWEVLFSKLHAEVFDAGESFSFAVSEDESASSTVLVCSRSLDCNEDIFLVDHLWTTASLQQAQRQVCRHSKCMFLP
jgi:hypothetical protein